MCHVNLYTDISAGFSLETLRHLCEDNITVLIELKPGKCQYISTHQSWFVSVHRVFVRLYFIEKLSQINEINRTNAFVSGWTLHNLPTGDSVQKHVKRDQELMNNCIGLRVKMTI